MPMQQHTYMLMMDIAHLLYANRCPKDPEVFHGDFGYYEVYQSVFSEEKENEMGMDAPKHHDDSVVDIESGQEIVSSTHRKLKSYSHLTSEGYKLHLAFDAESHARFLELLDILKAANFGEVIRRALQAYEVAKPEDETSSGDVQIKTSLLKRNRSKNSDGKITHVYIPVPQWVKAYLDHEKSETGKTYRETVRQSLRVSFELAKRREELLCDLKNGERRDDAKHGNPTALMSNHHVKEYLAAIA